MTNTVLDGTTMLLRFNIVEEPRGPVYRELLRWSADRCPTGLLVVRSQNELDEAAIAVLQEIAPAVTSVETTQQWPGTVLLSSTDAATVYRFQVTARVVNLLTAAVDGLYEWAEPARPDDLCLLRSDGSPMLVTIAHEQDAYLNLKIDEAGIVGSALPGLKLARANVPP